MFEPALILVDSSVNTQDGAIQELAERAKALGKISDVDAIKQAVYEREAQFATSMGDLIAIPHAKSDVVKEPFIAFLRTCEPFPWGEGGMDVQMIFLIGVPKKLAGKEYLQALAEISRRLAHASFRAQLQAAKGKEAICKLLNGVKKGEEQS